MSESGGGTKIRAWEVGCLCVINNVSKGNEILALRKIL
jgi:hypothetical protein